MKVSYHIVLTCLFGFHIFADAYTEMIIKRTIYLTNDGEKDRRIPDNLHPDVLLVFFYFAK